MTDLTVEDYSEKAIVVRGDTKSHASSLKNLGGKWNSRLRDGPGWIFSKKVEDKVHSYVQTGISESKAEINTSDDLLNLIESKMRGMTCNERVSFISSVAFLASSLPEKKVEEKKVKKDVVRKDSVEIEVESDSDSEEEAPRKRLLK